MLDGMNG